MRRRVNQAVLLGVAATIVAGSVARFPGGPGGDAASLFPVLHVAAYFALAAALLLVFHDTPRGHVEAVTVAVAFGVAMEGVQLVVPHRTFAVSDMAVNAAGASLVLLDHHVDAVHRVVAWEDRLLARLR